MGRLFKVSLCLMILAVLALPAIAGPPPPLIMAAISATTMTITPAPAIQVMTSSASPPTMVAEVKTANVGIFGETRAGMAISISSLSPTNLLASIARAPNSTTQPTTNSSLLQPSDIRAMSMATQKTMIVSGVLV